MNAIPARCLLCGGPPPLVNGHLIPDFAIRRLKKEGRDSFGQDPNRRVQDGVKEPLLCENCDGRRFSDAETSFASRIFHPFLDGQALQFDCSEADRYLSHPLSGVQSCHAFVTQPRTTLTTFLKI